MSIAPPTQMTAQSGDHARLLPKVEELAGFVYQGPANVESACRAVDYDMGTCSVTDFEDRNAFPASQYLEETKALQELTEIHTAGQTYVSLLYTYRSCLRAMSIPVGTDEGQLHAFHQKTFTVLHTEIQKLVQFMRYHEKAIETLKSHFQTIVMCEAKKTVESHVLFDSFLACVNTLILLDALRNNKASITNDFSFYKRSFSRLRPEIPNSDQLAQEIHELQMFLSNPAQHRDLIMFNLKQALQTVESYDIGLVALIDYVRNCIENRLWLLPDEEFGYLRVVPFLMYLLDTDISKDQSSKKKDLNVFRHKALDLSFFKKLYKQTPVVPLYGDMHTSVLIVLQQCPHWKEYAVEDEWRSAQSDKIAKHYLLSAHHDEIRAEYNRLTAEFSALLNETKAYQASQKQITPQMLDKIFSTVLGGLKMVAQWSAKVLNQCAWKYANPCPRDKYLELSGKGADGTNTGTSHSAGNPDEYEQAVRYNYTAKELYCLVDVISMIKGIGAAMLDNELVLTPLINRCIHDDVQIFLQIEVARPLRKAYKNDRKDVKDVLLQIREIGGDWFDYAKQKDDYLLVKKELIQVNRDFPRRPTAPSPTQLYLIRRLMHTVFSSKAAGMKGGFFSDKNLKDEWLPVWHKFYHDSFYYRYLLDYGNTIKSVTDMSSLWFHEFYLEMTGCVQFPISMSLPWVLTDYLINNKSMKENMLFPFDIYNDAAARALYTLKQQFLYDEIEAEVNLAFDQLVFHLSNDVFSHYKTVAGAMMLDKSYKAGFEEAKGGTDVLNVRHVRYSSLMSQTHVTLLGRNVDLTILITSHCNRMLRDNVHAAIRKFESGDFTGIIELRALLQNVQITHQLLSELLPLDPLTHIMREVDESVGVCQFKSRVLLHAFMELVGDVLPNYVFNHTTQRFVKSPNPIPNVTQVQRENPPKDLKAFMYYGRGHKEPFDREMQLYKGYVGIEHFHALFDVQGVGQAEMLLREIVEELIAKVIGPVWVYLDTVAKGMVPTKPPSAQYGVVGAYLYFDAKLKAIATWPQLRPGLFQKLREVGNGFALLLQLDDCLQIRRIADMQTTGFFSAVVPVPPRDPALPPLSEAVEESFIRQHNEGAKLPFVASLAGALNSIWGECASFGNKKLTPTNAYSTSAPVEAAAVQSYYAPVELSDSVDPAIGNLVQSVIRSATIGAETLLNIPTHNPPSIVTAALARIADVCRDSGMTAALGTHGQLQAQLATHGPRVCDLEQGRDLARVLSTLQFIFNQHPAKGSAADKAVFGDGFSYGLCALLHAMGERPRYDLLDFSSHLLRVDTFLPCPRDVNSAKKKGGSTGLSPSEEQVLPYALYFLSSAQLSRELNNAVLSLFETYTPSYLADIPLIHAPTTILTNSYTGAAALTTTTSPFAPGRPSISISTSDMSPMKPLTQNPDFNTFSTNSSSHLSAIHDDEPDEANATTVSMPEDSPAPSPVANDIPSTPSNDFFVAPPAPVFDAACPVPLDDSTALEPQAYSADAAIAFQPEPDAGDYYAMMGQPAPPAQPPAPPAPQAPPAPSDNDFYSMMGQPPPPAMPPAAPAAPASDSDFYAMMGQPPPPPRPM